jgi:hypothetical protein
MNFELWMIDELGRRKKKKQGPLVSEATYWHSLFKLRVQKDLTKNWEE